MSDSENKNDMEQRLAEMGSKIDELRAKAEEAGEQRKREINKSIENLHDKREDLQERLEKLHSASGEAWEDLKSGVTAAFDEFNKAFRDADDKDDTTKTNR